MNQADRRAVGDADQHQAADQPSRSAEARVLADGLLAGEGDVPSLLDDMQPRDLTHQRRDAPVLHRLALERVEDLLHVQRAGERDGRVGHRLEEAAQAVQQAPGAVLGAAEGLDHPAEHQRVPALVRDLGEGEARVRVGAALQVEVAEQHLHQDGLEPDAEPGDARDFVPGQGAPLLVGHLLPQWRAVERAAVLRDAPGIGRHRRIPVDLDVGVERVALGGAQQAPGTGVAVQQCRAAALAVEG